MIRCLESGADPLALKSEDASRFHAALPSGVFFERLTPLMVACEAGHIDIVKHLVDAAGVDPSQATPTGLTPLIAACQSESVAVVKYMISKGVNAETADGHGFTALWVACRNGDMSLVRYLVSEAGVNVNKGGDPHRGSALMAASAHGHLELVRWLVESAEADVTHRDSFGDNALLAARAMGANQVAEYLATHVEAGDDTEGYCVLM